MSRTLYRSVGTIALFLLLFAGCDRIGLGRATEEPVITEEAARLVSHTTAGTISSTDVIRVRFLRPVEPALAREALTFEPVIRGTAEMADSYTLVYQPEKPLPLRKTYTASIDLPALFPNQAEEPLRFTFETEGREVERFEANFDLLDDEDPESLAYRGVLVLTQDADPEAVRRAVTLRQNGRRISLTWQQRGREFVFDSDLLQRTDEAKTYVVAIDQGPLDLGAGWEQEIVLEPLGEFLLEHVSATTEGPNAGFTLAFNEQLARQNLEGLIRVEPPVDIRLDAADKAVYVTGDFDFGEPYTLVLSPGIASRWGTSLVSETRRTVEFEDIKPQLSFGRDGVFLPTVGERRLYFKTVNLRSVRLEVKKVFPSNLGQFLQTERLVSTRDRRDEFSTGFVSRVGVTVAQETLELQEHRNVWLTSELDLSGLIDPTDQGPFLISLRFEREDMIWSFDEDWTWQDDYYTNPSSPGYLRAQGRIYKPLIITDIGLTWKRGADGHRVFATNLLDGQPAQDILITLKSYQNQILAQGKTDREGMLALPVTDQQVFYVTGQKDGLRSVIKANEMAWNLSSFDTEGVEIGPDGTRAFLFTERGVYRPGDEITLSAIFRNNEDSFPDRHPVSLKLTNPRGQIVHETVNRDGVDGFYQFPFSTAQEDATGVWRAELLAGSTTFSHEIRVETIVPFRLKVTLTPERERLDWQDSHFQGRLESAYLFGAPASGLASRVTARLISRPRTFAEFPGFTFANAAMRYQERQETLFDGQLSPDGTADIVWELPPTEGSPSALVLSLTAATSEPGGREVARRVTVPVDPYPVYVGLQIPAMDWGYLQVGTTHGISVIAVGVDGQVRTGRPLHWRLFRNTRYWWWEYDNYDDFRLRYKTDTNTELLDEGQLLSKATPTSVDINPDRWGEYLLEVEDAEGHRAGFFFRASAWGEAAGGEDAGLLVLKADRDVYHPGDEAVVRLPSAGDGSLLVTVETSDRVLSARWHPLTQGQTEVSIPIDQSMRPGVYVTVSQIQPYAQTVNDRPIRLFGVVPIAVEDAATRLAVDVTTADVLEPNKPFTVQVRTGDAAQFVLAVVDEGLLDITDHKTPDPWGAFYAKQRLGVGTFDLFGQVIGAFKGDIFRTFSIGGGEGALMMDQDKVRDAKRFDPVVFTTPPAMTDDQGRAELTFTMPNYMGSVRLMAVAADGSRYGRAERAVPVRSDIVLLPTLPRVLGPGEEIEVPVSLFAMDDSIDQVDVAIEVDGPLSVDGPTSRRLEFSSQKREGEVVFSIRTAAAVGRAQIVLTATDGGRAARSVTHIDVRPSSPPIYRTEQWAVTPGESVRFTMPADGMRGTNQGRIVVSRRDNVDLGRRLRWLLRYPYGCIEQTTSAVFPQLYLGELIDTSNRQERLIEENVLAGIGRLRKFQLPNGGFSYWPGSPRLSVWGTNYAGHFLLAAEALGYPVPTDLKERWIRFQYSRSLTTQDRLMERVYRLYLLALADRPSYGAMNLIKENALTEMSDVEKWILAAAYELAGMERVADQLLLRAGTRVDSYAEFGGTYGSDLRDLAMILDSATTLRRREVGDGLYDEIAESLSTEDWYSTQTTGFCLLALGRYAQSLDDEGGPVAGVVRLPGGTERRFLLEDEPIVLEVTDGFGREFAVDIDREARVNRVFVGMEWEGVPLRAMVSPEASGLSLEVRWYDGAGRAIDPTDVNQGDEFWGHLVLKRTSYRHTLEEIAVTQIIPSGWEIENTRVSGEPQPVWSEKMDLGSEEYFDIRDDRVSWFLDMTPRQAKADFLFKVRAVTAGRFFRPPTLAEAMYRRDTRAVVPGAFVTVRNDR